MSNKALKTISLLNEKAARESIAKRRRCFDCAAYDGGDNTGLCRVRSPQEGMTWPIRSASDWCLEFMDK